MQILSIEVGENPPEVTVTALALIDCFRRANGDQKGDLFKAFMVMAGHLADPERFPLPQSFTEVGLTSPPEELTRFFENGMLSENTRAALSLLSDGGNADGSDLGALLDMAKKQFA